MRLEIHDEFWGVDFWCAFVLPLKAATEIREKESAAFASEEKDRRRENMVGVNMALA